MQEERAVNLKNQPTVFMPPICMFEVEREWGMSKAAWMDVAFDYATQISGADITTADGIAEAMNELQNRAELIRLHRKQEKSR
jgi:hypothetical protein